MARSKRSADKEAYWALMVEEQRRCGVSIRTFCQQKAISEPSFYAWRRELRRRDVDKAADNRDLRLISVDVLSPTDKKAPPKRHLENIRHHRPPSAAVPLKGLSDECFLSQNGWFSPADGWLVLPAD